MVTSLLSRAVLRQIALFEFGFSIIHQTFVYWGVNWPVDRGSKKLRLRWIDLITITFGDDAVILNALPSRWGGRRSGPLYVKAVAII